jgi:hypothetical protein
MQAGHYDPVHEPVLDRGRVIGSDCFVGGVGGEDESGGHAGMEMEAMDCSVRSMIRI